MNKKFLNVFLFSALCLGTTGTFTSCKDYDDDIKDLQGQITTMQGNVDDLKKKIEGGLVVTNVEKTADGVKITFSNGQTYELKNGAKGDKGDKGDTGAAGAAGKDAVVWTIGQDGFWYKDGVKTEYKAIGTDGTSSNGTNGANGANGYYYKPNTATGCFDVYVLDENGKEKFVEATNISYLSPVEGVSVVHDGNKLYINGAEDSEGNPVSAVELTLGKELSSVAFVPELLDEYSKYPLAKFYHVAEFLDESAYNKTGTLATTKFDFIRQPKFDKSNDVALTYRVNPQGAYVEGAVLNFINRSIQQTRAINGDEKSLMNIVASEINEEKMVVTAGINVSKRTAENEDQSDAKFDLAALQASVGTGVPVTSDYIAVRSEAVVPSLADAVQTTEGAAIVKYYDRTKAIASADAENDEFVKRFVPAVRTGAVADHLKFAYKSADGAAGSIDLSKKVGLYDATNMKWFASYNFQGMSFEFSLPKEYKDIDNDNTNQQWYVKLDGSVLSVNTDNLQGQLTQAIGRKPIVRVDAFMANNAGEKKLVASSYIRLQIVERDPVNVGTHTIQLAEAKNFEYHEIENTTEVINMGYQRISNEIYGVEGLTSTNFWDYYGGTNNQYKVTIVTYNKTTGDEITLVDEVLNNANATPVRNGIALSVYLNPSEGSTSAIKVGLRPQVKTQNTYKNMGKGAQYKVTIKIESDDKTQHGDFILTQVINVKDECVYYDYNPNYYFNSWKGTAGDYIVVKGKLDATSNTWKMTSQLAEHFKLIEGDNIFAYYSNAADPYNYKNVKAGSLKFKWTETDVTPATATTDVTLALDHAMTESEEIKTMNYEYQLTNNETCKTSYKVVFVNPFMSGTTIKEVSLKGNAPTAQTAKTAPSVLVVDKKQDGTEGEAIYEWNNNKLIPRLTLSPRAEKVYKIKESAVKVEYKWVVDDNYKAFTSQLTDAKNQLQLNADGEITWDNGGARLGEEKKLKVKATVTFTDLSEVVVIIPVTITTEN